MIRSLQSRVAALLFGLLAIGPRSVRADVVLEWNSLTLDAVRTDNTGPTLITRLLDESAALAREPEFLLREELRDLVPYHSVLMALARGKSSPAQLAKSTGIDVRGLNYHLKTLVELGYIQRRYPNARNATIGRRLFVRKSLARARLTDARVHTLQDLYDLELQP